ncbi:MAG TPA: guanylate kinase [Gemmatimonadales bacterium]
MTPRVVVLSSPSGGGKTTITKRLLAARPDVGYSVSATTRAPRPGEQDGVAYHFLSRDEFARREAAGEFLETAEYAGERYGTLKAEIDRVLASGRHVVLDIEVQGAASVRRIYPRPRSLTVFILPPGAEVWFERIRGRNTESPEALAKRLDQAIFELRQVRAYDSIVVNDDLDRAVAEVGAVIDQDGAQRHRPPDAAWKALVAGLAAKAAELRGQS